MMRLFQMAGETGKNLAANLITAGVMMVLGWVVL